MKKYEIVIWDIDGTLLDTSEGIIRSVKYCMSVFQQKIPTEEKLKKFIGPPIQESFEREYGISKEMAKEMAEVFRYRYKTKDLYDAKPYPNIERVLKKIQNKNVKQAVATNKREDYAKKIIDYFGLNEFLDPVYGSDFDGLLTKRDLMEKCLLEGRITDRNKAVMIGDSIGDLNGAESLGIDFIGVTYGFGFQGHPTEKNFESVRWADKPDEILEILEKG